MSAPELRQYQRDVIAEFHARVEEGCRRIILVAPTGSGKTVIAGEIIAGDPLLTQHFDPTVAHSVRLGAATAGALLVLFIGMLRRRWTRRCG